MFDANFELTNSSHWFVVRKFGAFKMVDHLLSSHLALAFCSSPSVIEPIQPCAVHRAQEVRGEKRRTYRDGTGLYCPIPSTSSYCCKSSPDGPVAMPDVSALTNGKT